MNGYVALLCGINVGGHRKVPMAELRALATELGLQTATTYVASGNLVFISDKNAGELETLLETAIAQRFGFAVDVIVRSAEQWSAYRAGNPMPEESERQPNLVMLVVGKQPAEEAQLELLRAQAGEQERIERRGDALWIWFGEGAGRSKIGTGTSKGVWTTRNWRTVQALDDMLQQLEKA